MADEAANRQAFRIQAGYCRAMDAPRTAALCDMLAEALDAGSRTGGRALGWTGDPVADGLALRLVGGLHALHRAGADRATERLFAGAPDRTDVRAVLLRHDAALLPWLDGPPQTNEPMRSGALMTGLLHLATRHGPRVEVLEIGASAGLNLLLGHYRYDLGGVTVGPADAAVTIAPAWRGTPPLAVAVEIVSARGVDVAPIDVRDPAAAARLEAYVWIDADERQARLTRAIGMARAAAVTPERGDAADWLEARLAEPQAAGVTRVLMHSVVWQYLGPERQARIAAAMAAAGERATAERPLGWVAMEPNRDLHRQEVRVRSWPGSQDAELVAIAHAHGAWVEGLTG